LTTTNNNVELSAGSNYKATPLKLNKSLPL
jgi:hypothetical protein